MNNRAQFLSNFANQSTLVDVVENIVKQEFINYDTKLHSNGNSRACDIMSDWCHSNGNITVNNYKLTPEQNPSSLTGEHIRLRITLTVQATEHIGDHTNHYDIVSQIYETHDDHPSDHHCYTAKGKIYLLTSQTKTIGSIDKQSIINRLTHCYKEPVIVNTKCDPVIRESESGEYEMEYQSIGNYCFPVPVYHNHSQVHQHTISLL